MATGKTTIDFILQKLGKETFSARAMFGEYALYAHGRLSALVCNDRLYVKIAPASRGLEGVCDKDTPYPAAKLYYVVDESQLSTLPELRAILCAVAAASTKARRATSRTLTPGANLAAKAMQKPKRGRNDLL